MSPGLHRYIEECGADDAVDRALDFVNDSFDAMFRGADVEHMVLGEFDENDLF